MAVWPTAGRLDISWFTTADVYVSIGHNPLSFQCQIDAAEMESLRNHSRDPEQLTGDALRVPFVLKWVLSGPELNI